jgi:hypothetical protein
VRRRTGHERTHSPWRDTKWSLDRGHPLGNGLVRKSRSSRMGCAARYTQGALFQAPIAQFVTHKWVSLGNL